MRSETSIESPSGGDVPWGKYPSRAREPRTRGRGTEHFGADLATPCPNASRNDQGINEHRPVLERKHHERADAHNEQCHVQRNRAVLARRVTHAGPRAMNSTGAASASERSPLLAARVQESERHARQRQNHEGEPLQPHIEPQMEQEGADTEHI